jgi:hypothetical protein
LGGGSGVARHGEDADLRTEGSGPGTEWEQRSTACARYVQLHPPRTVVDYYKGTVLLTSVTLDCSGGEYSEPLRLASCPRHRNRACSHPSASICVMRFSILPLRSRSKTSCFAAHAHLKKNAVSRKGKSIFRAEDAGLRWFSAGRRSDLPPEGAG